MTREELISKVKEETKVLLKKHGRCGVVECPGFGKTTLSFDLARECGYKKVVYIAPKLALIEELRVREVKKLSKLNIDMITYPMLYNKYKSNGMSMDGAFGGKESEILFILDEMHFCGATKWKQGILNLIKVYSKSHFLGLSTNPYRQRDDEDVIYTIFNGVMPEMYTTDNAIDLGFVKEPSYIKTYFSIEERIADCEREMKANPAFRSKSKKAQEGILVYNKKKLRDEFEYTNISDIMRSNLERVKGSLDYMKFIVFFRTAEAMERRNAEVKGWFSKAYPDMSIQSHLLTSVDVDSDDSITISDVLNLTAKKGVIDLVLCVDLLSCGIHLKELTGIVMLRDTLSNGMFAKQLGSMISMADTDRKIVFDLVGNWSLLGKNKVGKALSNPVSALSEKRNKYSMLSISHVHLVDQTEQLLGITRLYNIERLDKEDAVIDAYVSKHAPIDWCYKKLNMDTAEQFLELYYKKTKDKDKARETVH